MLRYLILKEVVFLLAFAACGAGFAAQLRRLGIPFAARAALAPAFGLAAAMCLLTTLNYVVPLRWALWFALVPLMVASLAWAARTEGLTARARVRPRRTALLDAATLATVVAIPLLTLNLPLDARSTQGPIAVGIFDSHQYVSYAQGFQSYTNAEPFKDLLYPYSSPEYDEVAWGEPWQVTLRSGWGWRWQHAASSTVPAAMAQTFGWEIWRLQSAYSLALLLVVALSAYGLTRAFVPDRRWPATLAGLAGAGPALYQLWADGSQGLLSGVALIPAYLASAWLLFSQRSRMGALLSGIVLAGIHSGYPEVFPQAAAVLGLLAAVKLAPELRRIRSWPRPQVREGLVLAAVVAGATLLASPRSSVWLVEYMRRQITDAESFINVTPRFLYSVGIENIPGWLLQTVQFYDVGFGASPPSARYGLYGLGLAFVMIGVLVFGLVRVPRARILIAPAVVAAAQAAYSWASLDCGYCVQRTLLVLAPVVTVAAWVGLAALVRVGREWRYLGAGIAVLLAYATVTAAEGVGQRIEGAAFMASQDMPPVLERVAGIDGPLQLEGFNATPFESWAEQPVWFQAVDETTDQRLSTPAAYNDYAGHWYTHVRPIEHQVHRADYEYVLTRHAALDSGREQLYQHGPVALERRARPYDVTLARGAAVDTARRDPLGAPWVQKPDNAVSVTDGPLTFWIAALDAGVAHLEVTLTGPPDARLRPRGARAVERRLRGGRYWACFPVTGATGLRIAEVDVTPVPPEMGPPTGVPYDSTPSPAKTIKIDAVRATGASCADSARRAGGRPV